ncbi:MAG TPA: hypothetical protein VMJ65_04690 [Solirubrobacteraceae bacterium]|nr:hypothetical protein [Solirubrobacteraceae bacterium]
MAGKLITLPFRVPLARHRSRRTVLAAVDRQLKLAGGGHPA